MFPLGGNADVSGWTSHHLDAVAGFGVEPRKFDAVAGLGAEPRKKIGVFHAISSIFDVVLTPTGGLAAAVSTEK